MSPYTSTVEDQMRTFFATLSEKDRRRYAAIEALKLGHGGQTYIAQLLGCRPKTIRRGLQELEALPEQVPEGNLQRIRRRGGGRNTYEQTHPAIDQQFLEVLADHTAGDPTNEKLRWTNLTHQEIAEGLREDHGVEVSTKVIRQLLKKHGYRPRKAQKNKAIKQTPRRNEQFEKIARLTAAYKARGEPMISIDTKKRVHRQLLPGRNALHPRGSGDLRP